jgi:aconitate hydratase
MRLAGTVHIDLQDQPIGKDKNGKPVFLKDLWPSPEEVNEVVGKAITKEMYATEYSSRSSSCPARRWRRSGSPAGDFTIRDSTSSHRRRGSVSRRRHQTGR